MRVLSFDGDASIPRHFMIIGRFVTRAVLMSPDESRLICGKIIASFDRGKR
jgi:hypothetical protein